MENRNKTVDVAKFVAALMIIAIHTNLFYDVQQTLNFVVVNIVCRLAVPLFAICTGYFLCKQVGTERTQIKAVFLRQWKKLAVLYGVWTVIYLIQSIPMWIEIGWFSPFAFVDYAIGALTKGSHYHLWYLWGMIYTLPVFAAVLYKVPKKYVLPLTVVLWLVKAVTYGYGGLLGQNKVVEILQHAGTFLCLLPLLLLGAMIADGKKKTVKFYAAGFCVSMACLIAEAFMLKQLGQSAYSYILFTLPTGYFMMQLVLGAKLHVAPAISKTLGAMSLTIYCVHPIFVELTDTVFQNSMVHFGFAAVASAVVAWVCVFVKDRIERKKVA